MSQTEEKTQKEERILTEISKILGELGKNYTNIGLEIGALVDEKNAAYGDSFTKAAEFLKILYPNGIPVEAYTDALCIVRIFDKLMRLATSKDYNNERPYADIAGYAFLGLQKDRQRAEHKTEEKLIQAPKKTNIVASIETIKDPDGYIKGFSITQTDYDTGMILRKSYDDTACREFIETFEGNIVFSLSYNDLESLEKSLRVVIQDRAEKQKLLDTLAAPAVPTAEKNSFVKRLR